MNCPLKGRFIYWGFVIPVSVLRLFKRLPSRAGACDVVLNDKPTNKNLRFGLVINKTSPLRTAIKKHYLFT
jgi:hypothetical protein